MNETYFEQLLQWLARCPALTGIDLRVDDLPPAAGTGALFPKGVEQTDRWQNLLGQVTARQKMQLVLRLKEQQITLRLSDEAKRFIAESGYDPVYGARPLKRTLQRVLETPVAKALLRGDLREGGSVTVETQGKELVLRTSEPR